MSPCPRITTNLWHQGLLVDEMGWWQLLGEGAEVVPASAQITL